MSLRELSDAIAKATGESAALIRSQGFSIADPLDANLDVEPRRPLTLDWDTMSPADWPI